MQKRRTNFPWRARIPSRRGSKNIGRDKSRDAFTFHSCWFLHKSIWLGFQWALWLPGFCLFHWLLLLCFTLLKCLQPKKTLCNSGSSNPERSLQRAQHVASLLACRRRRWVWFLTVPLACLLPPVSPTPSKVVLEVKSSILWIPASAWHSEVSVHTPADVTCWLLRSPPPDIAGSASRSPWSQAWYLQYNRWSKSLDWWMLKRCLRNPISCPLWFSDCTAASLSYQVLPSLGFLLLSDP